MTHSRRVAIVTGGAGQGIGSAVSQRLAQDGWDVLVVDRDEALAAKLAADAESRNISIKCFVCDLTDSDAPRRVVDAALNWRGRMDGLVNNVGIGCVSRADQITDEQFDYIFAVNVRAGFRLTREVVKLLPEPGGTIVNLGSIHGRQSLPGYSAYAATKGAVDALTRGWAVDFGNRGIRVNSVVPGMVDCTQSRQVLATFVDDVEKYLNRWVKTQQLLPELVTNANVAEVVAFLLGDKSKGITGQAVVVDAGTSLMLTDRE
jgi:NAD(P)-dependent dehydrogenase (short-subunit alcohol dehydrogenase family)